MSSAHICFTLDDLLTRQQCQAFIDKAESDGYLAMAGDYPPSYRDNDRIVIDDRSLSDQLFEELGRHLPKTHQGPGGTSWTLVGLNSRFRGCRYRHGQSFTRHRDGAHSTPCGQRSFLTVMLYLNDSQEFQGGHTRFYEDRWRPEPSLTVPPKAGTAIIFEHALWHDGQAVNAGTKYVLRTDVMYAPTEDVEYGHSGYIWDITELPDGRLASGSRDKTVRIWNGQTQCQQVLRHHTSSVTRLLTVGQALWSGSRDREVAIWYPRDKVYRLGRSFSAHQGAILNMICLYDGRVATSGADNRVCVWSNAGHLEQEFRCGTWPWALLQMRSGVILVGADDGTILKLDLLANSTSVLHELSTGVLSLLQLQDGSLLAGCRDSTIRRWQKFGRALPSWTGHRGQVTSLAELPCGQVASGSEDDGVRLWEQGESRELLRHNDFVRALCVTESGQIASGSYDGSLRLVSPTSRPTVIALTERAAKPSGVNSGAAAANW